MLSDRFCIASYDYYNTVFSPQDFISCDKNNLGCNGGDLNTAMAYLENKGLVTEKCLPYTSGEEGVVPECPKTCKGGLKWTKYKC